MSVKDKKKFLKPVLFFALFSFIALFEQTSFFQTLKVDWFFPAGYGLFFTALVFLYLRVSFFPWLLLLLFFIFKGFFFISIAFLSLVTLIFFPGLLNELLAYTVAFPLLKFLKKTKSVPGISETEREALEAGQVGEVEEAFFSGSLNFHQILRRPFPALSFEEKSFLTQETEELSRLSREWESVQEKTLSKEALKKAKKDKFLGLILPKAWGGLEFSPHAHSLILEKIASYHMPLATFVAIPNSLGPAELLLSYGTPWQQKTYLPRLASGEEIPCFALTEPEAGSDASSITSTGVLFKDEKGEIKIRLNWSKRWITLSTVATLAALAFRLKDPEKLLGGEEDLGITLALVPLNSPGVRRGLYHNILGVPLYNGPIEGEDVILNGEEALIGGLSQGGKGWKMIMESLSFSRAITVPSLALGGMVRAAKITGLYGKVRRQFGLSIGHFEGVEEPLARIAGLTFLSKTLRDFTLSDPSQVSPTVSAIMKYNLSEFHREVLKDSMDILSGAGITLGPKNKLALLHTASPIFTTVEGANILTRTFILFGQGLFKCHPFLYRELKAFEDNDFKSLGVALFRHVYHFLSNGFRALFLSLTRGLFVFSSGGWPLKRGHGFMRKLVWSASLFAFFSDIFVLRFGGRFRFKEKFSGRFADILSAQYMALALLWRWNLKDEPDRSEVFAIKWGLHYNLNKIQKSFEGLIQNINSPWFVLFKKPLYFLTRVNALDSPPSDRLSGKLARSLLEESAFSRNLTEAFFSLKDPEDSINKLKRARELGEEVQPIVQKIKKAVRKKELPKGHLKNLVPLAVEKKILSPEEGEKALLFQKVTREAVEVDAFTETDYFRVY